MQSKSKLLIPVGLLLIALGVVLYFLFPKKTELIEEIKEKAEESSQTAVIGHSVEGRDIESFTYGKGGKEIVFVGGIHGGYEWNSVLLAYEVMDYLDAHQEIIPANIKVTIIPSLNPDGVYKVTHKEGRFAVSDVSTDKSVLASGRFNAHNVDVNRNFNCKWQPESKWQSKTVSAGTKAFSEPEAAAIRDYAESNKPAAFVFWHSQANAAYASECKSGVLPETQDILKAYTKASGYPAAQSFDSYTITGESADWLASIGIPAISVELKTHESIEYDKNLAGVKALIEFYKAKS